MNTNNKNNNSANGDSSAISSRNNSAIKILHKIWRFVRIPFVVIVVIFVGLIIYRFPVVLERRKTQEVVDVIKNQKLTMADVMGQNLPPEPDTTLNNATLEGIDTNHNGIRDDVELAIFKLHPDSARIRAAELQYAMALQNEMTSNVFNSDTLVAVIQQEGRSFSCVGETAPNVTVQDSNEKWIEQDQIIKTRIKEVENLALNTESRKQKKEEIYKKYTAPFKELQGQNCDINLITLPN